MELHVILFLAHHVSTLVIFVALHAGSIIIRVGEMSVARKIIARTAQKIPLKAVQGLFCEAAKVAEEAELIEEP